jgi:hypothetical protein
MTRKSKKTEQPVATPEPTPAIVQIIAAAPPAETGDLGIDVTAVNQGALVDYAVSQYQDKLTDRQRDLERQVKAADTVKQAAVKAHVDACQGHIVATIGPKLTEFVTALKDCGFKVTGTPELTSTAPTDAKGEIGFGAAITIADAEKNSRTQSYSTNEGLCHAGVGNLDTIARHQQTLTEAMPVLAALTDETCKVVVSMEQKDVGSKLYNYRVTLSQGYNRKPNFAGKTAQTKALVDQLTEIAAQAKAIVALQDQLLAVRKGLGNLDRDERKVRGALAATVLAQTGGENAKIVQALGTMLEESATGKRLLGVDPK